MNIHHNIVSIYDVFEHDGVWMMEMEWIDGYDLHRLVNPDGALRPMVRAGQGRRHASQKMKQPLFRVDVAVKAVRDCLNGLHALHKAGIVHGNIEPSNIMFTKTGTVKLLGLGSARDVGDLDH